MSITNSVYDTRDYLKSQISTSIKVAKSLKKSSRNIFMADGWKTKAYLLVRGIGKILFRDKVKEIL